MATPAGRREEVLEWIVAKIDNLEKELQAIKQRIMEELTSPSIQAESEIRERQGPAEILLEELVERGPEPGVAYLLDGKFVGVPALPSAILASRPWRNCNAHDVETAEETAMELDAAISDKPLLLILTRAIYLSHEGRVSPDKNHVGFVRFQRLLGLLPRTAVMTHKLIYDALPEGLRARFRPVKVALDLRGAAERVSESIKPDLAPVLAVPEALLPGICQAFRDGGRDGVYKLLLVKGLRRKDAGLIADAIAACAAEKWEGLGNIPTSLRRALGIRL